MADVDRYLSGLVENLENLTGTLSSPSRMSGSVENPENLSGTFSPPSTIDGKLSNATLRGYSAYDVAVEHGFVGTEEEWLASLKGDKGDDGVSVTHSWDGTTLTVTSASGTSSSNLKGEKGDQGPRGEQGRIGYSAYEVAVQHGFVGTEEQWLASIKGEKGDDGISVTHSWDGTTLTVTSASGTSSANLKGEKGDTGSQGPQGRIGYSAYEVAVQHGFVGTEQEWLDSVGVGFATDTKAGIMKLYNETGENTDGTMTQRSITHAIADNAPISIPTEDLLEILV